MTAAFKGLAGVLLILIALSFPVGWVTNIVYVVNSSYETRAGIFWSGVAVSMPLAAPFVVILADSDNNSNKTIKE